ncbi:hypothetical protein CASFOL_039121 [Castilleja foliolosa]|uniref:Uncharacterized protein n=1 Tax=Castilleja foliolosa TaxID=1961234 RepID=A0ABD3BIX5_9LAMI
MELKRNLSAAHLSSASACSEAKRRATPTPTEDSPLGQLFNDVSIHALMREVRDRQFLVRNGKKFLISLQRIMDNFHEESADDIYNKARHLWEIERSLVASIAYTAKEELADKLVFYSNEKSAAERMDSMMKDPWLKYILGDSVLGLQNSEAFIRGFLSILIAYWNMKDLTEKYNLGIFGRRRTPCTPSSDVKIDRLIYVIDHIEDFTKLRELLESKYGSDPNVVANLFEKIREHQLEKKNLARTLISGKQARITATLLIEGSRPPVCRGFAIKIL